MKLIRILGLPFVLAAVLLLGGCATMSSHQAPDANLNAVKTIYVVRLAADHRGVNRNLADALSELGYRATTGEAGRSRPKSTRSLPIRTNGCGISPCTCSS